MEMKDLAPNNGENGKPVWVAYDGKVFDLSESSLWEGGSHMGSHQAGADLTEELTAAPHGPEMLERYQQVGSLRDREVPKEQTPAKASPDLLTRFPVLRRHPHPMTVHFPIAFMFSAAAFTLLYLITGVMGFEMTAFYCLGAGLIFIPVAIGTGYITWRINYGGRPMRPVSIKKALSAVLLCVDAATFIWRVAVPGILRPFTWVSGTYLALVLCLVPLVIIIGWYGATLTFPLAKPKR